MRPRPIAIAALVLLAPLGACSRHGSSAPADASPTASTSATVRVRAPAPAPGPAPDAPAGSTRHAWIAATTLAQPPVPLAEGVAGVVAHVPEGLDAAQPLHLVLFFHGSDQCIAQIAMGGDVVCKPGARPDVGAGLAWRHDDAGTASIFAAPQFALWGGGTPGRMAESGYFRSFVEELLGRTFAPGLGGPKTLDDLADVTIVAHSAGHIPLAAVLDRGGLDDKVKNVVLLDALYDGTIEPYARWLERGAARGDRRKLVAVYGPWGRNAEVGHALAARAEAHAKGSAAVDPPGALADAVRSHTVTVKTWPHLEHAWMVLLMTSKTLEGLGLPPRPVSPPRVPYAEIPEPAPMPLAVGDTRSGTLDDGDAVLQEGSLYEDYALDLEPGQRVAIDARGGRSFTEPCCSLDVVLDVLRGGEVVAHDDDGGGFFDAHVAHVEWSAPARGRYVVRVSTYGSGRRRGPYTLVVR